MLFQDQGLALFALVVLGSRQVMLGACPLEGSFQGWGGGGEKNLGPVRTVETGIKRINRERQK